MIVVDVPPADHDQELEFWQAATGKPMTQNDRFPEYHWTALDGQGISMLIQRLDAGPGRVHVDIHTDDLEVEVARLERLGAQRIRLVHAWWVMRDPAGLPFCVVPEPAGTFHDGNAQRWD